MEVILLERIEKLGQMGDVVKVKNGYARNYLLPQKKALRSTEANKVRFKAERSHLEAHNLEKRNEAEAVGEKLSGQVFIAIRQAGENGQIYGSVTTREIADLVTAGGFSIKRSEVKFNHPVKMNGVQAVQILLHPEVSVKVYLNVARSDEEAQRQTQGEIVTGQDTTDEEAIAATEVFEREELAQAAKEKMHEAEESEGEPEAGTKPTEESSAKDAGDAAEAEGKSD